MAEEPPTKCLKTENLHVAKHELAPKDLVVGCIWLGPASDNQGQDLGQDNADATVAAAVAAGIKEFDTAPWYGLGCSEERLGRATKKLAPGSAQVTTKAGRMIFEPDGTTPCISSFEAPNGSKYNTRKIKNDYTAKGAVQSHAQSLARLGMDAVHGLRIHDPNDNSCHDGSVDEVDIALQEDGMLDGLRQLREEGKISHVGLGMNCSREAHMGAPDEILRLIRGAKEGTFDSALLAGGWNLLSQTGQECLLECQKRGIEVHVAGIYASGLLVGVDRYAYKSAPAEVKEKVARWQVLADKHGVSLPAVAMAFSALPTVVTRVVLGVATPKQVEQNLATLAESNKVQLSIWKEAQDEGLIAPEVRLPQA